MVPTASADVQRAACHALLILAVRRSENQVGWSGCLRRWRDTWHRQACSTRLVMLSGTWQGKQQIRQGCAVAPRRSEKVPSVANIQRNAAGAPSRLT